ncbi:hypothetical protein DFJ77DRAFT_480097 [Powellomyces hirtus]|nr:hypothetical protein DFJ77DRAFT_480097 [Powellomyces hirtus]
MRDRVPTIEDEFDRLSLVSRDTSTADEKTSVKNRHVQQRFYSHIVAQFDELHRVPTSAQKAGHYDPVLAKLRKLREGITASSNYDAFAVQVYEYSADICLIARNFAELLKSLVGLTNTIYPAAGSTPLHRGAEFAAYMLLYLICYARGSSAQTYGNPRDVMNMYKTFPPWVQDHERVRLAMRVFRALRADLDYVELNALWNVGSTSERVFLEVGPSSSVSINDLWYSSTCSFPCLQLQCVWGRCWEFEAMI